MHTEIVKKYIQHMEQYSEKCGYDSIAEVGSLKDQNEIGFLQSIIAQHATFGTVVEIGCLFGHTTQMIAATLPNEEVTIYAVDCFNWNPFGYSAEVQEKMTRRNLHYLLKKQKVSLFSMDKNDFYKSYKEKLKGKVSVIFLDAEHSYEETKKDIQFALEIECKCIVLHDYSETYEGVKKVVNEFGGVKERVGSMVLLNLDTVSEKKVSTYKSNILVLTAHSVFIQDEANITVPLMQEYCNQHGYDFKCLREGFDNTRPYVWGKLKFIQEQLAEYEWVVWIDTDCLITNPNFSLESIIQKYPNKELLVAEEVFPSRKNPNTGVLFVKNTDFSKQFLKDWYSQTSFIGSVWEDQSALHDMLQKQTYPEIALCPQKQFNSMYINHTWSDGDFILHLAGLKCNYPNLNKPDVLKEYALKIRQKEIIVKEKYLHEYFDKVYMVNLKDRTDRANQMKVECDKIGLQYTRFEAINSRHIPIPKWVFSEQNKRKRFSPGAYALAKTTLQILDEAIEKNFESILILEDDIKWNPSTNAIMALVIKELPSNWSILQLSQMHDKWPQNIKGKNNIKRLIATYHGSAYAIHYTVFQQYRAFLLNPYMAIDDWMVKHLQPLGNCFGTYPNLAAQVPGVSDISYKMEDWAINEHDFSNKPPKDIYLNKLYND